jgi:hypothetical protein
MLRKILTIILVFILSLITLVALAHLINFKNSNMIWGVSFNAEYARYLGLDPQKVLHTILYDWGFREVRMSVQWDSIESDRGQYNFSKTPIIQNSMQNFLRIQTQIAGILRIEAHPPNHVGIFEIYQMCQCHQSDQ